MTVRIRLLQALAEAGDTGLSRSELQRAADCNPGRFRTVLTQLVAAGDVVATEERTKHGPTMVHRLKTHASEGAA